MSLKGTPVTPEWFQSLPDSEIESTPFVLVQTFGSKAQVALALTKQGLLRDVKPSSNGFSTGRLFGYDVISKLGLAAELVADVMPILFPQLQEKAPNQFPHPDDPIPDYTIEIGIYALDDVRVWRVRKNV